MNNRFKKNFSLEKNLYCEGVPLVISAGALSLDLQKSSVFVQLKFRNISSKAINALTVEITPKNVSGEELGEKVTYSYLDLNCPENGEFGGKTPIFLPDKTTRSFSVKILTVVFDGNETVRFDASCFEPLPEPKPLGECFTDNQILAYKRTVRERIGPYFPLSYKDIYICTCGRILRNDSSVCPVCSCDIKELLNLDVDKLECDGKYINAMRLFNSAENIRFISSKETANFFNSVGDVIFQDINLIKPPEALLKKSALYKEAAQSFEEIADWKDSAEKISYCNEKNEEIEKAITDEAVFIKVHREKTRKTLKKLIIGISAGIAGIIVFLVLYLTLINPFILYFKAAEYGESGKYEEAYSIYGKLGGFMNADDRITELKHKEAYEMLENGDYDDAYALLEELGESDAVCESKYVRAKGHLEKNRFDEDKRAWELLDSIKGYKDAEEIANSSRYRRGNLLLEEDFFDSAYKVLEECIDYSDAAKIISESCYTRADAYFEYAESSTSTSQYYLLAHKLYSKVDKTFYPDVESKLAAASSIAAVYEALAANNYYEAYEICEKMENKQYAVELQQKCKHYTDLLNSYCGDYLMPLHSITVKINVRYDNGYLIFNCSTGDWSLRQDYRDGHAKLDLNNPPEKFYFTICSNDKQYNYRFAGDKLYCTLSEDDTDVFTKVAP